MGGPIIRMLSAARNFHLPEEAGEVSPPFWGCSKKKRPRLGFVVCLFSSGPLLYFPEKHI